MRRVLLTGASGFIARNALPALLSEGCEVYALCRHPGPERHPLLKWIACDVFDHGALERVLAATRPDSLLHLAWKSLDAGAAAETDEQSRPWIDATLALLDLFAAHGGHRAVIAGSGAEYAWPSAPCTEDLTPLTPESAYGRAKHALHVEADARCSSVGVALVWARLFFLYGPFESPRRFVPSIISGLLEHRPVTCGHGLQLRDYLHAQEAGEALCALLACDAQGAFNIGSGAAIRLRDLAGMLQALIGHHGDIHFAEPPLDLPPNDEVTANITRITRVTGWAPRLSLEAGLRSTIAWWRSRSTSNSASFSPS